jgi:hypothetical protein
MKKWLRGIKSKVDTVADSWLNGEENRAHEEMMERANAEMQEALKPIHDFIRDVLAEDLDVTPTTRDISRYFHIYKGAREGRKKVLENMGVWTQDSEDSTLGVEEYEEKAGVDGWKFLRESVGLPLCDLNKPRPSAWKTPAPQPHSVPKPEGWDVKENNS